jgi:hypothetical protein
MRKFTKRSAALVTAAVVAVSGGAAWAINGWDIGGTGEANGQASEIKPLTASTAFTDKLFPGAKSPLVTNMTNPNDFPVQLTGQIQVTNATVTPTDDSCKAALLQAGTFTTAFPGTPEIAAGQTKSVPGEVTIGDIPQSCANKAVKIDYSFTAKSLTEA